MNTLQVILLALGAVLAQEDPDRLVEQLGSSDYEVQGRAAKHLEALGSRALPALERALKGENKDARQWAERLLKAIGTAGEKEIRDLVAKLSSDGFDNQAKAAEALASLGSRAIPFLKDALSDEKRAGWAKLLLARLGVTPAGTGNDTHRGAASPRDYFDLVKTAMENKDGIKFVQLWDWKSRDRLRNRWELEKLRAKADPAHAKRLKDDLNTDNLESVDPEKMIAKQIASQLPELLAMNLVSIKEDDYMASLLVDLRMRDGTTQRLSWKLVRENGGWFQDTVGSGMASAKVSTCANNLRQLWTLQTTYMSKFGGRMKAMPAATGPAFWLALTKTQPPLVGESELGVLVCPLSDQRPKADFTTYRGPQRPVNTLKSEDPVGCCEPGDHPDGTINVLCKDGSVQTVGPSDPLYKRAVESTTAVSSSGDKK